jgi:hypothetical protein
MMVSKTVSMVVDRMVKRVVVSKLVTTMVDRRVRKMVRRRGCYGKLMGK